MLPRQFTGGGGGGGLPKGLKRPMREGHHASPSSSKVKNTWNYTPLIHSLLRSGAKFLRRIAVSMW